MSSWIRITATLDRQPEDWSPWAECFDRFGCNSTLQVDDPPSLCGYLEEVEGSRERAERLTQELGELGSASVRSESVPDEDWSETWKRFFKPRRVGRHLVIRPTWEDYKLDEDDIEIVLNPGQAFGTGDHPTTRLCLELLEKVNVSGLEVADVGCGSGILSIAAKKLGALSVMGSDLDEQSVAIARENAKLNEVEVDFSVAEGFSAVERPTPVVLSNIISATLIRLAPEASRVVASGGVWIVSGIIEQNWPDVLTASQTVGFRLEERVKEDEWVAASLRR